MDAERINFIYYLKLIGVLTKRRGESLCQEYNCSSDTIIEDMNKIKILKETNFNWKNFCEISKYIKDRDLIKVTAQYRATYKNVDIPVKNESKLSSDYRINGQDRSNDTKSTTVKFLKTNKISLSVSMYEHFLHLSTKGFDLEQKKYQKVKSNYAIN